MFLEFLCNNIQPLSIESDLFLIGDFNMPQSTALNSFFEETSLTQLVKKPTHRAGNILDLLVTNEPYLFSEIEQQHLNYSDHDLIKFCLFNEVVSSNSVKQTVFGAWKKADINKLANDVEMSLDLNGHLTCVDTAAELLVDSMDFAAKEAIPIERRSSKLAICPFFDRELQDLKRDRRKLEKKYKKNPDNQSKEKFLAAIRRCKEMFKRKKTQFFDEQVNRNVDLKKKYSSFNMLMGVKTTEKLPVGWGTDAEIAQKFNTFSEEKVTKIKSSIENATTTTVDKLISLKPIHTSHVIPMSVFNPVDLNALDKAFTEMSNSYCELDSMPTVLCRQLYKSWKLFFLFLINMSFQNGIFPKIFKKCLVKPKLKKQSLDTEDPKSYRPIANSSFLSKLLERTAAGQLRTHLDQNCLLDPQQSAYRRFHSTESCLLKTINDLYVELDQGKYLLVIGLDLSAAFDTLDFANFGKILEERFKIIGKCKQWIMSYLTERKQQTQIRK